MLAHDFHCSSGMLQTSLILKTELCEINISKGPYFYFSKPDCTTCKLTFFSFSLILKTSIVKSSSSSFLVHPLMGYRSPGGRSRAHWAQPKSLYLQIQICLGCLAHLYLVRVHLCPFRVHLRLPHRRHHPLFFS